MKTLWKLAATLSIAVAGVSVTAVPAQAQGYGWRGDRGDRWEGRHHDRRWDNRRWDNRRWDGRRDWRDDRRHYRGNYRMRQRCWTEWRYDRWRDRDVRVRICR